MIVFKETCVFVFFPSRLAKDLIQVTQLKPEPWIAMGHFCNATNREPRTVYFAEKVSSISVIGFLLTSVNNNPKLIAFDFNYVLVTFRLTLSTVVTYKHLF